MKPKCFLLLVFLGIKGPNLAASFIDESKVKSYVVERRDYNSDLFTVNMKDGEFCAPHGQVWSWCAKLSATVDYAGNRTSCRCACKPSLTFVSSSRKCVNEAEGSKFGGCQDYISVKTEKVLDLKANLTQGGTWDISDSNITRNSHCSLYGEYFDYNGFKIRWKMVRDGIFNLIKGPNRKLSVEWKDVHGILSGRIIRLTLVCSKSSNAQPQSSQKSCILFKALGSVTYYSPRGSASSVKQFSNSAAVPTAPNSNVPLSSAVYSPPPQLLPSQSPPPSPSPSLSPSLLSSPSSLLDVTTSRPTSGLQVQTGILSPFISTHMQTTSLHTRPISFTSGPILPSSSKAELQSVLPVNSQESANQVIVNTGIPKPAASTVESSSSEPSESTTQSSPPTIEGPGDKEARTSGNDNGVVIGAAVGGAVGFGIFVIIIIVFCKRRKLWKSKEKEAKLEVKNPVYGKSQDDIQMERPRKEVTTSSEQDSQQTYLKLVNNYSGQVNGGAVYSTPQDNYDNCTVYQSLDKKTAAAAPVYQTLAKGQHPAGKPTPKPKPSTVRQPSEKPSVSPDPMYNVLEQPHVGQGNVSEDIYNVLEGPDPGSDGQGNIQDPLYNVLEGSDAGQTYEAPNVGVVQDPVYNVLDGPESKQDHQDPLYNVLESADAENSPPQSQGPYDGASNEPLYNVLEGEDSDGPNRSGSDYAAPNRPLSAGAHDNPAYEQTLEFDVPYSVHSPGSQRESVYEPLKGSERHDLYEPLNKRGK